MLNDKEQKIKKTIPEYEKMTTEQLETLSQALFIEMKKCDAVLRIRELKEMK